MLGATMNSARIKSTLHLYNYSKDLALLYVHDLYITKQQVTSKTQLSSKIFMLLAKPQKSIYNKLSLGFTIKSEG